MQGKSQSVKKTTVTKPTGLLANATEAVEPTPVIVAPMHVQSALVVPAVEERIACPPFGVSPLNGNRPFISESRVVRHGLRHGVRVGLHATPLVLLIQLIRSRVVVEIEEPDPILGETFSRHLGENFLVNIPTNPTGPIDDLCGGESAIDADLAPDNAGATLNACTESEKLLLRQRVAFLVQNFLHEVARERALVLAATCRKSLVHLADLPLCDGARRGHDMGHGVVSLIRVR